MVNLGSGLVWHPHIHSYICKYLFTPSDGADYGQSSPPQTARHRATLPTRLGHDSDSGLGTGPQIHHHPQSSEAAPHPTLPSPAGALQGATISLEFTRGRKPHRSMAGAHCLSDTFLPHHSRLPGVEHTAGRHLPAHGFAVGTLPINIGLQGVQSNLLPPPLSTSSLLQPHPHPRSLSHTDEDPPTEPCSGLSTHRGSCHQCLQPRATSR